MKNFNKQLHIRRFSDIFKWNLTVPVREFFAHPPQSPIPLQTSSSSRNQFTQREVTHTTESKKLTCTSNFLQPFNMQIYTTNRLLYHVANDNTMWNPKFQTVSHSRKLKFHRLNITDIRKRLGISNICFKDLGNIFKILTIRTHFVQFNVPMSSSHTTTLSDFLFQFSFTFSNKQIWEIFS